jgi:hypothetical protein
VDEVRASVVGLAATMVRLEAARTWGRGQATAGNGQAEGVELGDGPDVELGRGRRCVEADTRQRWSRSA